MVSKFIKILSALFILAFLNGCQSDTSSKPIKNPKIAIAGLAIESSTFSPATTDATAFLAREGTAIFDYYPFLKEGRVCGQSLCTSYLIGRYRRGYP